MKVNMGQPNDLLIDDLELLLREIDEFNSSAANNKPVDIPQTLDNYLQFVAKSGNTVFPWPHVRALFRTKMVTAIQQFQEPTCPSETFVLERFDLFRIAAPFTVQRLTELILQPTRHYRKKEKFLRGLEKTVLVVSTVEPRSLTGEEEKNGSEEFINTSASSCEAEGENLNNFNRTFSVGQQDMVTVRSSPIELLTQNITIASDGLVIDPVTTSVASATVDVDAISHTINAAADAIIGDSVTTSSVSVDVITPDITIVSSDSILINAVTDPSAVSIDADEGLPSAMECESSTTTNTSVDVSPVTLLQCVTDQDLVSTAMRQASEEALDETENVLEDVTSSLVNMDAVKLPLEVASNVSVDHTSSTPENTETTGLFECVTVAPENSALVTSLDPEPSIENSLLEPENISGSDSESVLVDVSQVLVSSEKNNDNELEGAAQQGNIQEDTDTTAAMDCETLEEQPQFQSAEDSAFVEDTPTESCPNTIQDSCPSESKLEGDAELSKSEDSVLAAVAAESEIEVTPCETESTETPTLQIELIENTPTNSSSDASVVTVESDKEGSKTEATEEA